MESVTVIIPVFNTQKTLEKCFLSIQSQTWRYFEVLLIDDSSTDNSLRICEEWASKDSRFHVLRNRSRIHGPSKARNLGLDAVTTKYVTFMDSDDWIEPYHLEYMMTEITRQDVCAIQWTRSDQAVKHQNPKKIDINRKQYINKALGMKTVSGYLVNKVFNMDIINDNNIRLNEAICSSEDLLFTVQYLLYISKGQVVLVPASYHYIARDDSLTRLPSRSAKELFAELHTVNKIGEVLDSAGMHNCPSLKAHYVRTYYNIFTEVQKLANKQKYGYLMKILRSKMWHGLLQNIISREFTLKSKIKVFLVIFAPNLHAKFINVK